MRRPLRRTILMTAAALLLCVAALASPQDTASPQERPKIGVALGGGGARGFAHIGVLQWLEENHIPVDYVAGTSMGGLVGAMYCGGMTPAQMRDLVTGLNWDEMLRGGPAYDRLTYRRKQDRRDFQAAVEMGANGGLTLPRGIDAGHPIGLLLNRLTLPYGSIKSFDELPIPFRCVATDMEKAEPVVLKDGSLSEALRATMAIPGVFTPVEMNGRILADGGLLDNVPVDVLKDMGADIIIAVDVGTPLGDRKSLQSLLGIVGQSIGVATIQSVRNSLRQADIVLSPDLGQHTSIDYPASAEIVSLGYSGAQKKAQILKSLALADAAWRSYAEARAARVRTDAPVPQFVEVTGADANGTRRIQHILSRHTERPLPSASLEHDLTGITGWGPYESLSYETVTRGGQDGLLIRVKPKRYGPPFVNFALDANGAETDNVGLGLAGRLTAFDLGGYGSELRVGLGLGSRYGYDVEYLRPVAGSRWFVAPRLYTQRRTQQLYEGATRVAQYRINRQGLGVDIGYSGGERSDLRLGVETGDLNASVRIGNLAVPGVDGSFQAVSLRWSFDGQDNPAIPAHGAEGTMDLHWYLKAPGAPEHFLRAEGQLSAFQPVSSRGSLFVVAAGGTTMNRQAPSALQFTLGGPLRLGAYEQDEFRGSRYLLLDAGGLREVARIMPVFGGKVYAGGWVECGSVFEHWDDAETHLCATTGILTDTVLGPLFAGGSWGESGRGKVYFQIGRLF